MSKVANYGLIILIAMRYMKKSILEEPLIHIIIWIKNDDFMNEEDDKAE